MPAGGGDDNAIIDPGVARTVYWLSPAAYLPLIPPRFAVLGFGPSSPDDTLQGREAGVNPAQSRYGDHRLDRPSIDPDGSPVADPQWLLDLREKG
jgi:hypothetical protein